MHYRLVTDVGLGNVIGVKMGERGMVSSWVVLRLSFGMANSFSISLLSRTANTTLISAGPEIGPEVL